MDICIRKLTVTDLPTVNQLSQDKISATNTDPTVFQDPFSNPVYKHFILDDRIYGSEFYGCWGYFIEDELQGVLGFRCIRNEPAWVLSFIVTSSTCKQSITVIKELLQTTIADLESRGYFQWFVVSKLEKFKIWQKLFKNVRPDYNHYVYARTPANELPKWNSALAISGNKLFPYDTNISMYISKSLCTTDQDGNTVDIDDSFL